jgi:hypothetical protein
VYATRRAGGRWWPALDGLRGVAILVVLAFHAGINGFVGGYLGVDVFFTLSGFLITFLLVDEFRRTGRIDLSAFWRRRARRILPALVLHPAGNPVVRLLAAPPLRWFGAISYGLYLWHWPVFLFLTPDRAGLDGTPLLIIRLSVSIALAWASWHLLEQPIRQGRLRLRIWLPASTGVVAVAVAVLVVVHASQPAFRLPEASALRKGRSAAAAAPGRPARPHLFFAGDSIALTFGAGVSAWADKTGRAVVTGHPLLGCGLMDDLERRRAGSTSEPPDYCAEWKDRWRFDVARHKPDAAVLVLSVWDLQEHAIDGHFVAPGDAAFDRAFLARFSEAIDVLSSCRSPLAAAAPGHEQGALGARMASSGSRPHPRRGPPRDRRRGSAPSA